MSLIHVASFVDILYEMKIGERFQELSLRFLDCNEFASFVDIILYEMEIGAH